MCVIIAKNKNDRLPTEEELINCFNHNSDGAGFMYTDNKTVIIDKGYMTLDTFLKRYNYLVKKYNNFKNKSLVIHCRIGTSSANSAENTHPYPITNKEKYLHKTYFKTSLGIVHNGIIPGYTPYEKNTTINDTQNFILKYIQPLYKNYKYFYKNEYILNGLEKITNSKLVFMDGNDFLYYVGKFENEKGLKFSNSSYMDYKTVYTYYGTNYTTKENKTVKNDFDDFDDYKNYNYTMYNYYNDETDLIYLDKNWYIEDLINNDFTFVTHHPNWKNLLYDLATGKLYELKDKEKDLLTLISDSVVIYDENYEEVL